MSDAPITLRDAGPADAPAVAALHAASWRATYRGIFSDRYLDEALDADRAHVWHERLVAAPSPARRVILAERAQHVLGFACTDAHARTELGLYLDNLHVQPDLHGVGIGRTLMRAVACNAHAQGHRGMFLEVLERNLRTRNVYRHLGAEDIGHWTWEGPDGQPHEVITVAWRELARLIR